MKRISVIVAASLVLAGCAASDDRRGAAPPTSSMTPSSIAPADRASVTVERVEDATTPGPRSRPESRPPIGDFAGEAPLRDAPAGAPRSRFRSITEEAPMAKPSTTAKRDGAGRFRQITE